MTRLLGCRWERIPQRIVADNSGPASYIGMCLSPFRSKLGICQNNAQTFQTTDKRSLHGRFSYQVPINRWLWTIWNGLNRSLLSPRFLVSVGEWKTPGECDEIAPANRHAGEQGQQQQHIMWRSRFSQVMACLGAGVWLYDLRQVGATGEGEGERDYIPIATLSPPECLLH